MKAAIALILIYIGTFLVAIQGSSSTAVQAAQNTTAPARPASANTGIDPAKEDDIRALLELVGARDLVQDSMTRAADQYREKLMETVPNNQQGQSFVDNVIASYRKKFDVDSVTEQLVSVYDKHYSDEEIKGLLQFYGSPLGQKVAAEGPRIARELQEATRASAAKAVKEALQEARQENPGIGQNARLGAPGAHRMATRQTATQDSAQEAAQQQTPQ